MAIHSAVDHVSAGFTLQGGGSRRLDVGMVGVMAKLAVSFKPHPVNGWWLRLFSVPYVAVDAGVTACSWTRDTIVDAQPGRHRIRTFIRYRRLIPGDLGTGTLEVDLGEGQTIHVQASNGLTNDSAFTPRIIAQP